MCEICGFSQQRRHKQFLCASHIQGLLHPPNSPVTDCSLAWLAGTDFRVATTLPPHNQHSCHSMCHSHGTTMDPDTCQATYLLGLSKAHALHEQSVAAKTLQQWHKNARELAGWLHSTNIGQTLHSCLPEDIMVYFITHWLPTHAGTTTKTGHRCQPLAACLE